MKTKLWIDDVREPPDETWHWVKTSDDAIKIMLVGVYAGEPFREISFDHDLGGDDDAYNVATMIEDYAHQDYLARVKWSIHSANPVGRARIQAALMSADRYWTKHEQEQQ